MLRWLSGTAEPPPEVWVELLAIAMKSAAVPERADSGTRTGIDACGARTTDVGRDVGRSMGYISDRHLSYCKLWSISDPWAEACPLSAVRAAADRGGTKRAS